MNSWCRFSRSGTGLEKGDARLGIWRSADKDDGECSPSGCGVRPADVDPDKTLYLYTAKL